ncbi:MAG: hypothetical protein KKH28_06505, partial [Elusimicrobia bacterium]|nr:hypothetical protein [Elusimicrobiota bacterium]
MIFHHPFIGKSNHLPVQAGQGFFELYFIALAFFQELPEFQFIHLNLLTLRSQISTSKGARHLFTHSRTALWGSGQAVSVGEELATHTVRGSDILRRRLMIAVRSNGLAESL